MAVYPDFAFDCGHTFLCKYFKMKLCRKILLDLIVYVLLTTITFLLTYDKISSIRPFVRGFSCTDESLAHPVVKETIGDSLFIVITLPVFPFFVIIVEGVYAVRSRSTCERPFKVYLKSLYRMIGAYLYGGFATLLVVQCLKLFIGRLRPNFFAACQINFTAIDCTQKFILNYTCGEPDEKVVADLRKSFPSAHSAIATYGMLYLIIYLQFRMVLKRVRLFRPLLQTLAILLAVFICSSRLQDYRHHHSDVTGGAIVGAIGCLLTVIFLSDKMKYMGKAYILKQKKRNEDMTQLETIRGIDNEGFRGSTLFTVEETSLEQNGRSPNSGGEALP